VGIWAAVLHHTKMVGGLATLRAAVSSATGSVLGRSPAETSRVEVMEELVAKFWRLEEMCSWLEQPNARICDLLLGPPLNQARCADYLDEAVGRLQEELVARREVNAELEALQTSAEQVRDLVLGNIDELSSLAASLSAVVELLEGLVDTTAANGVRWVTRSALVAALSHFLELETELELLMSGHNADLIGDQAYALWTRVHAASDLLVSHVSPSVARSPPDSAGE
jgi:hypothetical protein